MPAEYFYRYLILIALRLAIKIKIKSKSQVLFKIINFAVAKTPRSLM
jgi:hypothetical protein